ncbi:MAG: hypothetical protein JOY61_18080 [Chloroflexi bacterium]|nr:hypothetical protein [Chloroflexota bacterium]
MASDDDRRVYGPGSFMHLDVRSSYAGLTSPNTPQEYALTLARQFPLDERTPEDQPKPAIALADYGLQSVVKMAVACSRSGVEHMCGLHLRIVPEASWHRWAEQVCELIPIAGDEEAWLSLVALHNRGHLSGTDLRGPRLDLQDLEELCRGELLCLSGPPLVGVLSPSLERCADPTNPVEAFVHVRRLRELFPDRFYLELAYSAERTGLAGGGPGRRPVASAVAARPNHLQVKSKILIVDKYPEAIE